MNTKHLLSSLVCSLCLAVTAQANAKTKTTHVDQQTQKYHQVCKSKKQGDMVSFAYKGVIFNGVCENDGGKLMFQPPMPANGMTADTQSRMSETQSAPRPVSNSMNSPMTATPDGQMMNNPDNSQMMNPPMGDQTTTP